MAGLQGFFANKREENILDVFESTMVKMNF
jgi:hypothetical protein